MVRDLCTWKFEGKVSEKKVLKQGWFFIRGFTVGRKNPDGMSKRADILLFILKKPAFSKLILSSRQKRSS